jgi:hypothetical protein
LNHTFLFSPYPIAQGLLETLSLFLPTLLLKEHSELKLLGPSTLDTQELVAPGVHACRAGFPCPWAALVLGQKLACLALLLCPLSLLKPCMSPGEP